MTTADVRPATEQGRRHWWRLSLAVPPLAFLAFALPPYLSLDPARSRVPVPPGLPLYYPLLVAHVVFASVAIATACLQLSGALRRRHPAVHRAAGRVYVLAGVVPAGLAGLVIGALSPFGPVLRASDILLALLWLASTITGFRMGRQRRFVEHRRWMTRSVILTFSIISNRVWAVVFTLALAPQLATLFGGSEAAMVQAIAGLSGWLGWVLPLVAAEWWLLDRT